MKQRESNQLQKAQAASLFAYTQAKPNGYNVIVPGSHGKQYLVLLRVSNKVYTGECLLMVGDQTTPCPSTPHDGVCYHILAALIAAARGFNQKLSFTESQANAVKLSNIGGKILRFRRKGKDTVQFAVAYQTKRQKPRAYVPTPLADSAIPADWNTARPVL